MLTLVAVLLHPPILHPSFSLCYLLCCSLFILCSGKDLPWSHWCCLHKRQNSIWCKAAQASSHVFWGKIRGKKDGRMMRRSLPAPFHSMHHHASHWSQFAIERKIRVCGEKKNLCKMQKIFPNDLHFAQSKTTKMWFLLAMNQWRKLFSNGYSHFCLRFLGPENAS